MTPSIGTGVGTQCTPRSGSTLVAILITAIDSKSLLSCVSLFTLSNISSEVARPVKAKFQADPPCTAEMKVFKCSNGDKDAFCVSRHDLWASMHAVLV